MEKDKLNRFVESWGIMGSVWGMNTSTARVHALLIATDEPLSLDNIAKRLSISRGNASMCLKELRNWGVIKQVKEPGDRKDYYVTEPDIWKMFFAIARERKKREFDPAVEAIREVLPYSDKRSKSSAGARLQQMEEFLTTLDRIAERFLENEEAARSVLSFLSGSSGADGS